MSDPTRPDTESIDTPPPAVDTQPVTPKRARSGPGGFTVFVMMLIPLAAAGWVAYRQLEMEQELAALQAAGGAPQQIQDTSSADQLAELQQRQQELDARLAELDTRIAETAQQPVAPIAQDTNEAAQETTDQIDQSDQIAQVEARLAQTSQLALEQTQQQLAESSASVQAQAAQIAEIERQLAAMEQQLTATQQASERDSSATQIAEAEMLLRLAQQHLGLARDTASAMRLYVDADELLRAVDHPAVVSVRETLARELAELQSAPVVDVPGLFARLGELAARVENFSVVSAGSVQEFSVSPAPESTDAVEPTATPGWFSGVKQTLGEYFVVSSSTEEIQPQLSANEQFQLRALVQLQLEQARLALLRADPEVYQQALDEAASTAQQWLRGEQGSLEDFLATLQGVRDTPIVVDLPEADEALAALRQLSGASSLQAEPIAPPLAEIRP